MAKRKNADEDYSGNSLNKKLRMELNSSICDKDFVLTKEIVESSVLTDISQNKWRVGKPIGECDVKERKTFSSFFSSYMSDQFLLIF